jgi:hypothetical protein
VYRGGGVAFFKIFRHRDILAVFKCATLWCMKTEVYSWRVSTELKTTLENEARRRKISLAAALDLAAQDWLKKGASDDDEPEQKRLHEAASKFFGVINSGDSHRSENVRKVVRERLQQRYGR